MKMLELGNVIHKLSLMLEAINWLGFSGLALKQLDLLTQTVWKHPCEVNSADGDVNGPKAWRQTGALWYSVMGEGQFSPVKKQKKTGGEKKILHESISSWIPCWKAQQSCTKDFNCIWAIPVPCLCAMPSEMPTHQLSTNTDRAPKTH